MECVVAGEGCWAGGDDIGGHSRIGLPFLRFFFLFPFARGMMRR